MPLPPPSPPLATPLVAVRLPGRLQLEPDDAVALVRSLLAALPPAIVAQLWAERERALGREITALEVLDALELEPTPYEAAELAARVAGTVR